MNLAELGALAYIDVRKRSQGSDFARYRFFWDALFLLKDDSKFKKRLSEFHKSKYLSDIKYVIHPSLPILVDAQIIEIAKVKGINEKRQRVESDSLSKNFTPAATYSPAGLRPKYQRRERA